MAAAAVVALGGSMTLAGTASADVVGAFCPAVGGTTRSLNAYGTPGDRCTSAFHTTIGGVAYDNALTPVIKCAVVKPNSDGSGGNVGGVVSCPSNNGRASVSFGFPGVRGYATGINKSSHFHTGFLGTFGYYN